jgi:hypothetical protein
MSTGWSGAGISCYLSIDAVSLPYVPSRPVAVLPENRVRRLRGALIPNQLVRERRAGEQRVPRPKCFLLRLIRISRNLLVC